MSRQELMKKQRLAREAKKKGVDAKKYIKQQANKTSTTWTDSKGVITQARQGEIKGEHVSVHRGTGGKGKPTRWQRAGDWLNRKFRPNRNKLSVKR